MNVFAENIKKYHLIKILVFYPKKKKKFNKHTNTQIHNLLSFYNNLLVGGDEPRTPNFSLDLT